jgi:Fe2+ or Zn2+ uptake regulation protein
MSNSQFLVGELRSRGYRITPQRSAILEFLQNSRGHYSPAAIYSRISERLPGVTETTIYRTLEFLAVNGMVLPSLNFDGHLVYEVAGRDHHHLICRSCGASMELDHSLVHDLYNQIEKESGYEMNATHLTFFGLCPVCRKKSNKEK